MDAGYPRRRAAFWAAALVAAAALAAGVRAACYLRIDNDGMRYSMVADQIRRGNGLKVIVYGGIPCVFAPPPDPSGLWADIWQPPMTAALYALLGGMKPGRLWPAQVVNVIAHIVTSLCAFLIARRCAGPLAGAGAGAVVALSYPLLMPLVQPWTEPPFIALFMLTIALLQSSRAGASCRACIAGSGLAAAAACVTRTVGVALVPLFFYEAVVAWLAKDRRRARWLLFPGASLPFLTVGAWALRNMALSPSVVGYSLPPAGISWPEAIKNMLEAVLALHGANDPSRRVAMDFLLFSVPASLLLLSPGLAGEARRLFRAGLDLPLAAAVLYGAFLTFALSHGFPVLDPRYAIPMLPLFAITAVVIMSRGWDTLRGRGCRTLPSLLFAASVAAIAGGEAMRSDRLLPSRRAGDDYGCTSACVRWVAAHNGPKKPVATNAALSVAFFTGMHTVAVPYRHPWVAAERLPDDLERRIPEWMRRVGSDYLLLLRAEDGLPREEWGRVRDGLRADVHGDFIARLSRPSPVPPPPDLFERFWTRAKRVFHPARPAARERLIRVYECPDGVVYRLAGEN